MLDTYIVIEQEGAVLFLDKHAAHERILFEKLRSSQEPVMAQVLLSPLAANLSPEEAGVVLARRELLEDYGYQVEDFGDGTVLLRQIPADLPESEAAPALQALAQQLLEGHSQDPRSLRDSLLHTIACKAAIKGGWKTAPRSATIWSGGPDPGRHPLLPPRPPGAAEADQAAAGAPIRTGVAGQ